jgi:hypothetical protein
MRLSRDDQVAGLPAAERSRADAPLSATRIRSRRIGSWIYTGSRPGTEVARAFAEAGYLRVSVVQDGETYWETTIKVNALTQVSFGRATAKRHLAGVIDRVRRFNADGSHLVVIAVHALATGDLSRQRRWCLPCGHQLCHH